MDKVALITGITGQDGAYLAELLLDKGYIVLGIKRRSGSFISGRIDHLYHDPHFKGAPFSLHYKALTVATNIIRIIQEVQPDIHLLTWVETYSVWTFCEKAFKYAGLDLIWEGEGVNEKGKNKKNGKILVEVDPKYFRPTEVERLIGDATKAKEKLGWKPMYDYESIVKEIVQSDMSELESLSMDESLQTNNLD